MEIVIRIIVSLIVVLAVGSSILLLSNNILIDSKENIDKIGDIADEDKLINKNFFESSEIIYLVESCYESQSKIFENELCFILSSNTSVDISSLPTNNAYLEIDGSASKTIFITYLDNKYIG
jgi:hypothetical protein